MKSKGQENQTEENKKIESPFKLFSILKKQKTKEKDKDSSKDINPIDELIEKLTVDLKFLKTIDFRDEKNIEKIISEKEKQCIIKNQKIAFVEVIYHSLKKNKKNENDILILKLFFFNMEKFISLLIPLKVNISDLLVKLLVNMKCEKKARDNILFRIGDIGQKLYILLKGSVGVIIKKEKIIECTPFEYIKYLIVLHLFQEYNYILEVIARNKKIINIEEETITNFLQIFKIYNFLKQNKRLKEDYKSIFDFVQLDAKFKKFFEKKYKYTPNIALNILNFSNKGIEQLYEFYERKIEYINKVLRYGLRGSDLFASFIKRQINNAGIVKPMSQQELLTYLKPYDEGIKTFKNDEEYYQKILSVNEISPIKIMKTTIDNYIKNLESETILNDIRMDEENFKFKIRDKDRIIEDRVVIRTYEFFEINQLYDGAIFGELALTNPNSKRTATIITKSECYFGTIVKQYYDLSFRAAQEKSQLRNIYFFTSSPIFKGINSSIFLNRFFYTFKKRTYQKGALLYKKGEKRKYVIFIIKGELEIKTVLTMNGINNLINALGGVLDEKYIHNLLDSYEELRDHYNNYKYNIKLCVLKDKEILGFDDMAINGINIFDVVCTSPDKTELYELAYSHIKEAKKFEKVVNNINAFVNKKRKFFIDILLEQRNTIIKNEIDKIIKMRKILSEPKKSISVSARNNKNFLNTSKDNLQNNPIILSYKQKQKDEIDLPLDKKKSKSLIKYDKNKSFKMKKFLTNSSMKNEDKKIVNKNKEEDIDEILTSFTYNTNSKFIINDIIRSKLLKKKENHKEKIENYKDKLTNENNFLKMKKFFFSRNPLILDDINSKTTKTKITNLTYKPIINNICLYRTRKNIIPYTQKSKRKTKRTTLTPFFMKECQKQFTETRNKIYMNNFYYKRQKIFKSLLNNDNELIQDGQRASDYSSRKMKISNSQFDYSNQIGEQNENNLFEYLNRENKISRNCQTGISIINKIDENIMNNKKNRIIDFLCLDNWEEKENFTKRFLSENKL